MIRLRSFGMFSIQVADAMLFVNKVVGTRGIFKNEDIEDYLRDLIVARLTNIIGDELKSVFDMPTSFDELSLIARAKLQSRVWGLGAIASRSLYHLYFRSRRSAEDDRPTLGHVGYRKYGWVYEIQGGDVR